MSLRALVVATICLLLIYFAVELGWGGGDPNRKDRNNGKR
jgi:hypothetical protein